ncbi:MAG: hypothetical protein ACRD2T_03225, partial [Thermoanaerobaculia bacterium]
MKLELTQRLQQQQILAPQMILSMDILLLTNMELENRIQEEYTANPALEIVERKPESVEAERPISGPSPDGHEMARQEAEIFGHLEALRNLPTMAGYDHGPRHRHGLDSDDKFEALANAAGKPEGLREHLIRQIHLLSLPREIAEAAEYIVNNLDERGYLLSPVDELRSGAGCKPEEFQSAWDVVRGLDPTGVGAQDLRDCLILQLERERQDYGLEKEIIRNHLEDLRLNKLPKIARDLGRTVEEIQEAREIISLLQPSPGDPFDHTRPAHVRPEVVVDRVDGKLEVKVDDESIPQLQISDSCRAILKQCRNDPTVSKFLRKKIESAQWLIQAVRQRQRTLHDIARVVVDYQKDFMEHGPTRLRA